MPINQKAASPKNRDAVLSLGADVGSTTAKIAVLRGEEILYTTYERHYSRIRETLVKMLEDARSALGDEPFTAATASSRTSKTNSSCTCNNNSAAKFCSLSAHATRCIASFTISAAPP